MQSYQNLPKITKIYESYQNLQSYQNLPKIKGGEESCNQCIWPADYRAKKLYDTVEFIRPRLNVTQEKFQKAPSLPRPMCCGDAIVFGEPDDQVVGSLIFSFFRIFKVRRTL